MEGKVIFEFPVLYEGWECDPTGWVYERHDGSRYLVLTSHGSKYISSVEELKERIDEYKLVIAKTIEAIALVS